MGHNRPIGGKSAVDGCGPQRAHRKKLELLRQSGRLSPLVVGYIVNEDQKAIEQVLAGNLAAFEVLVTRHQRRLLGLLAHACGSRDEAEDLAQEAFARAFNKLHLYAGQAQFYTWLCRIAMNLLASQRRRKRLENQTRREGFETTANTFGLYADVEKELERVEMAECVHAAIALLDEEKRTVLLMRDFDGLDYDAIATVLEVPVGTVRSRLHRARLELKEILEQRVGKVEAQQ